MSDEGLNLINAGAEGNLHDPRRDAAFAWGTGVREDPSPSGTEEGIAYDGPRKKTYDGGSTFPAVEDSLRGNRDAANEDGINYVPTPLIGEATEQVDANDLPPYEGGINYIPTPLTAESTTIPSSIVKQDSANNPSYDGGIDFSPTGFKKDGDVEQVGSDLSQRNLEEELPMLG